MHHGVPHFDRCPYVGGNKAPQALSVPVPRACARRTLQGKGVDDLRPGLSCITWAGASQGTVGGSWHREPARLLVRLLAGRVEAEPRNAPPPPHSQELALPHLPSVSTQRGWLRILGPRELEENTLRCRKSRMPWYLAAGHGHYGQLCFSGDSCRNQADVLIFRGGPDGETVNPVLLLFLSS